MHHSRASPVESGSHGTYRKEDERQDKNCDHFGSKKDCSPNFTSCEDAICVRSETDIQSRDDIDDTSPSWTQNVDVDDPLDGNEVDARSIGQSASMSIQERLDNGISLPISDVSRYGDVTVTSSNNVNVGNTNIFHEGCIVTQTIYRNVSSNIKYGDINQSDETPGEGSVHFVREDDKQGQTVDSQNAREHHEVTKWWIQISTRRCVAVMICTIMVSFLITAVVVVVVSLPRESNGEENSFHLEVPEAPMNTVNNTYNLTQLRLIKRKEWGALPPARPLIRIELPVPYVIITDTGMESCNGQSDCEYRVRNTQWRYMTHEYLIDIPYNFLVGGDGFAYEGCGWDFAGTHSGNFNKKSIGISFIGTFDTVQPPNQQLLAAQQLVELGVKEGKIANDYKLLGHRQNVGDQSPGDVLYGIIKTWPHWSPHIE